MQSSEQLTFRLDSPAPLRNLDLKAIPELAIHPLKVLTMVKEALEGNLRLLEVLTLSFKETPDIWERRPELGEQWKDLHKKLSDEEKSKCNALQQTLQQLFDIASHMLTEIKEKKSTLANIMDQGCEKFETVLSKLKEEKQPTFTHIQMDSWRLSVLMKNLFAARQQLLAMEKDQKDTSTIQHNRFFQKSAPKAQGSYDIPNKVHQIWMGSKLPPKYIKNKANLAKRANQCEMNLWSFDSHVMSNGLVPHVRKSDYDLVPQSDAEELKPNVIYFRCHQFALIYGVVGSNNQYRSKYLEWVELPPDFPRDKENILKNKDRCLAEILKFSTKAGLTKQKTLLLDLAMSNRHKVRNIIKELYPRIREIFTPEIAKEVFTILDLEGEGFKNEANRSDLIRYIIELVEGGWYMDTDLQLKTHHEKLGPRSDIQFEAACTLVKDVLTLEENHLFRLGCDPDLRDMLETKDTKGESKEIKQGAAIFDAIVDKLRNEFFLKPIKKLKESLDADDLKLIAKEQPTLWEDLEKMNEDEFDKTYKDTKEWKYRTLYLRKFLPQFIRNLPEDKIEKDSPVDKLKKRLAQGEPDKIHLRNFSECDKILSKSEFGKELKLFNIETWYKLESFLKAINFAMRHPDPRYKYGVYNGNNNNCFIGAVPHHKVLYDSIIGFVECFQMFKYQMPLDVSIVEMSRGPIRVGENQFDKSYAIDPDYKHPDLVARMTHCTLMDIKRYKKSLYLTEKELKYERDNDPTNPAILHRRELGIKLGVCSLVNVQGKGITSVNTEKDFGIHSICDSTWLKPGKLRSFDTTDCRKLRF